MIAHANQYLKQHGFDRSYIPSEFAGLYEHYLLDIRGIGKVISGDLLEVIKKYRLEIQETS